MGKSKHQKSLANIHRLEHELGMIPGYEWRCPVCRSIGQNKLYELVKSRYDPLIEGEIKR